MKPQNNKENCRVLARYFNRLLNCDGPKQRLKMKLPIAKIPDLKPSDEHEVIQSIQ